MHRSGRRGRVASQQITKKGEDEAGIESKGRRETRDRKKGSKREKKGKGGRTEAAEATEEQRELHETDL